MENKHLENARDDLRIMYCGGCGEFKSECRQCGYTFCLFCEFDCEYCFE